MKTSITSQTEVQAEFTVALEDKELREIKAHVFDDLRGRVKASGFRPGKAPDAIVERELGSSMVQGEFVEHGVQHTYSQAVKDEHLAVVSSPNVTLTKFVPYTELEYKVTVELMPKVKLADYKKLTFGISSTVT